MAASSLFPLLFSLSSFLPLLLSSPEPVPSPGPLPARLPTGSWPCEHLSVGRHQRSSHLSLPFSPFPFFLFLVSILPYQNYSGGMAGQPPSDAASAPVGATVQPSDQTSQRARCRVQTKTGSQVQLPNITRGSLGNPPPFSGQKRPSLPPLEHPDSAEERPRASRCPRHSRRGPPPRLFSHALSLFLSSRNGGFPKETTTTNEEKEKVGG